MFNALAFNCDYKDAIGECFFGNNIFLIYFLMFCFASGAANEASYWGSASPGK